MKRIFIPITFLLLLVGCDYNDKYFDGLDEMVQPEDIKKIEYTLLDEDYAAIAGNSTNKTLAEENGVKDELSKLGTTKRFSETLPAELYAPAFIASKWYTADDGSSIKLTYNKYIGLADYVNQLNEASIYKVSAEDYTSVWGEGSTTNFFTPATPANTHIPGILKAALPEAESGDIVALDYNESASEPSGAVVAINENFNHFTTTEYVAEVEGWHNVITIGTYAWTGRVGGANGYLQASAYNHSGGESEAYMITPKFKVSKGQILSFEACYANYREEGGRLAVLISSNLSEYTVGSIGTATWDDVSTEFVIEIPSGTYGDLKSVGELDLDKYIDKEVNIAFKYYGNNDTNATTTVRIDNVVVKSEPTGGGNEDTYTATTGLFTFNGTVWATYSGNGYMVTKSDYTSMGLNYDNFSSSVKADDYLPVFLKLKYPYAKEGDIKAPTYKYYDSESKETTIHADEYVYTGDTWLKNSGIEAVTDQFVLNNRKWNFDPSVVIILKPGKNQPDVSLYYQSIVNYVASTYGGGYYQTGYENAEYYYGASSYQNNFDFRISAWRNSHSNGAVYADLDDKQLEELMFERLKEAFIPALKANNGDMAPIEGIDVICTIRFGVYVGSIISEVTHEIKFKVTASGEFEYVENSLLKL